MNAVEAMIQQAQPDPILKKVFLKWQCRVRQNAMRDNGGRPDDGILPAVYLPGESEPLGHIITLLHKTQAYSVTPELNHMLAKTNDPAQRREQALRFFSSSYYQKASEFSDLLTTTFPASSPGAHRLVEAGEVTLVFDAFAQIFRLNCKVVALEIEDAFHQATVAHNRLFNPALSPDVNVVGFQPDWTRSSSNPEYR